jgi:hypothetical protein
MPEEKVKGGLTKEQKTGFVLLLVFAILAVGLGFMQIRNTMYAPFALKNSMPFIAKDTLIGTDALRYRDTDKDGLSDFDELYVYGSSQYLDDTDSDGIKDGAEISVGKNPACAEGETCSALSGTDVSSGSIASSTSSTFGMAVTSEDITMALKDPKQVRQMLITAGMEKTDLDKISDTQLIAAVNEIMIASLTLQNIPNFNFSATSTTN